MRCSSLIVVGLAITRAVISSTSSTVGNILPWLSGGGGVEKGDRIRNMGKQAAEESFVAGNDGPMKH